MSSYSSSSLPFDAKLLLTRCQARHEQAQAETMSDLHTLLSQYQVDLHQSQHRADHLESRVEILECRMGQLEETIAVLKKVLAEFVLKPLQHAVAANAHDETKRFNNNDPDPISLHFVEWPHRHRPDVYDLFTTTAPHAIDVSKNLNLDFFWKNGKVWVDHNAPKEADVSYPKPKDLMRPNQKPQMLLEWHKTDVMYQDAKFQEADPLKELWIRFEETFDSDDKEMAENQVDPLDLIEDAEVDPETLDDAFTSMPWVEVVNPPVSRPVHTAGTEKATMDGCQPLLQQWQERVPRAGYSSICRRDTL